MLDAALHDFRAVRIRAADDDLLFIAMDGGAADGAVRGRYHHAFISLAELFLHHDDGGNDLTGFFDDDDVADADVFALDLLVVVQRGVANGAAAH